MKEASDVDFYVEWSSVVESWTFAGTRAEMLAYLSRESDPWLRTDAPHHPEQRLGRADETGTSSLWVTKANAENPSFAAHGYVEDGSWEDGGEIYMQLGYCSRPNIFTLVKRQAADPDAEVQDLLSPFEDGCRCGHAYAAHRETGCVDCGCLMSVAPSTEGIPHGA